MNEKDSKPIVLYYHYAEKLARIARPQSTEDSLDIKKSTLISAAALCTLSELTLNQTRSYSQLIIKTLSSVLDPTQSDKAEKAMYFAADTVGFSLEGIPGHQLFPEFSSCLMRLLFVDPDIELQLAISNTVYNFMREYISVS